jgi:ATP-dependent protease Clp ATPase subunit
LVVFLSSAVTFTENVFFPIFNVLEPVPLTCALESVGVAYIDIFSTDFGTDTLYVVVAFLNPLKSFGLIPELIGRLPVITYMDDLDEKALRKILTEPKNALVKQYKKLFILDGIELTFESKVFDYIVERAIASKLGARGLRVIMEDLMTKLMFSLPTKNVTKYKVTLNYAKKILDPITYKI